MVPPGTSSPAPSTSGTSDYSGSRIAGRKACRPIRHQGQPLSQSSIFMALLLSSHLWNLDKQFRDYHSRPSPDTSFQQDNLDFLSSQIDGPAGCAEQQGGTKRPAVAAPLPGNFPEKALMAGNFTEIYPCQGIWG